MSRFLSASIAAAMMAAGSVAIPLTPAWDKLKTKARFADEPVNRSKEEARRVRQVERAAAKVDREEAKRIAAETKLRMSGLAGEPGACAWGHE